MERMDVELLIAKVYERQPVWNKWNKHHGNRNVVDRLWAEISQELNCEGKRMYSFYLLSRLLVILPVVLQYGATSELIITDLRVGLRPHTQHTRENEVTTFDLHPVPTLC